MCRADDGSLREATFEDCTWFRSCIQQPPVGKLLLKIFRQRFRIPYSSLFSSYDDIKYHELFDQWNTSNAVGKNASDIILLLLGTLGLLGRAHAFDDSNESTCIPSDDQRVLFAFLEFGSTVLHEKYVLHSLKTMDLSHVEKLFRICGFNECMGSSDATQIGLLSCPSWTFNNHKGFTLAVTLRNYNATATHWRQIMGTTFGHPGTWNDKTLVIFDELTKSTQNGELIDKEFGLFELDANRNAVLTKYSGS